MWLPTRGWSVSVRLSRSSAAAIRGGAGVVQYREKNLSTRQMVESAAILRQVCRQLGAVFLVNDRLDVALAVDADGVHLGQNDMPVHLARRLLGNEKLLGVSVQDARAMDEAVNGGCRLPLPLSRVCHFDQTRP